MKIEKKTTSKSKMGGGLTNKNEHYHIYDYETDFFSSMTTYHGLVIFHGNFFKYLYTTLKFCNLFSIFFHENKGSESTIRNTGGAVGFGFLLLRYPLPFL